MKTFEAFKASREKIDPTTRKMNSHQWEQAYAAYRSARERVGKAKQEDARSSFERRRSAPAGSHRPTALSATAALRREVRAQSAYAEARSLVNAFCWLAIASSVLTALLKFAFYAGADSQMLALVTGAFRVFIVLVVKYLAQILIDLPDIALYRCVQETRDRGGSIEA